jgi:hypothetical protein
MRHLRTQQEQKQQQQQNGVFHNFIAKCTNCKQQEDRFCREKDILI